MERVFTDFQKSKYAESNRRSARNSKQKKIVAQYELPRLQRRLARLEEDLLAWESFLDELLSVACSKDEEENFSSRLHQRAAGGESGVSQVATAASYRTKNTIKAIIKIKLQNDISTSERRVTDDNTRIERCRGHALKLQPMTFKSQQIEEDVANLNMDCEEEQNKCLHRKSQLHLLDTSNTITTCTSPSQDKESAQILEASAHRSDINCDHMSSGQLSFLSFQKSHQGILFGERKRSASPAVVSASLQDNTVQMCGFQRVRQRKASKHEQSLTMQELPHLFESGHARELTSIGTKPVQPDINKTGYLWWPAESALYRPLLAFGQQPGTSHGRMDLPATHISSVSDNVRLPRSPYFNDTLSHTPPAHETPRTVAPQLPRISDILAHHDYHGLIP